jgi:hypothetical protein
MWPAATCIAGDVKLELRGSEARPIAPTPRAERKFIVVKYWRTQELSNSDHMAFEFFGAEATERMTFPIAFPFRFYPAIWTPALGEQHLLPDAGLIVFAEGYWPAHVIPGTGRRCCEAPPTGTRHWHVVMVPLDQPPAALRPAKGWDVNEFPTITPPQLDATLKWNAGISGAERRSACEVLKQMRDRWGDGSPRAS